MSGKVLLVMEYEEAPHRGRFEQETGVDSRSGNALRAVHILGNSADDNEPPEAGEVVNTNIEGLAAYRLVDQVNSFGILGFEYLPQIFGVIVNHPVAAQFFEQGNFFI